MNAVVAAGYCPPLSSVISDYLARRWPSGQDRTYKDHHHRLACFLESAGDLPIDQAAGAAVVQRFLYAERLRGLGGVSLDNHRRCLSSFFAWLMREGVIPKGANPADRKLLNCPPSQHRCRRPVSDDELNKLLCVACHTPTYPYILLCVACGLRTAGAVRVQRHHMDLVGRTLVVTAKGRERVVPLSQWFCDEISRYLDVYPWRPMHHDSLHHAMLRLRREHGLPSHVTLQALRRTFLKKLLDADVPVQKAAAICGNSMAVIQKHYVELETLNSRAAVDAVKF